MLKLVFDTNTLISAFFWQGKEFELFQKIEQGKVELYLSQEILEEIKEVLNRDKFKSVILKTNQTPNEIIQKIISVSNIVMGEKLGIKACRDDKDNKLLECAILAKADYLVSGDEDLLVLKKYEKIKVVKSSEILSISESSSVKALKSIHF